MKRKWIILPSQIMCGVVGISQQDLGESPESLWWQLINTLGGGVVCYFISPASSDYSFRFLKLGGRFHQQYERNHVKARLAHLGANLIPCPLPSPTHTNRGTPPYAAVCTVTVFSPQALRSRGGWGALLSSEEKTQRFGTSRVNNNYNNRSKAFIIRLKGALPLILARPVYFWQSSHFGLMIYSWPPCELIPLPSQVKFTR